MIHFFSSKGEFGNNKSPFPLDILSLDDFAVYVRQLQTRQGEYISLSSLTHPFAGYAVKAIEGLRFTSVNYFSPFFFHWRFRSLP